MFLEVILSREQILIIYHPKQLLSKGWIVFKL